MKPTSLFISAILVYFIHIINPGYSQVHPDSIITRVIEKRAAYSSLTYDINFLHKGFSWEDTGSIHAKVSLIRVPDDTLFHGLVLIRMDTIWYGYDGEKIFSRSLKTNEILFDNAATSPGLFIIGRLRNNLIDYEFLNNRASLREIINDPQYECRFSDEFVNGKHCLGMYFRLPDNGEVVKRMVYGAIDTSENYFIQKSYSSYYHGDEQYEEWNYSDMIYGHFTEIPDLDWTTYGPERKETQYFGLDDKDQIPDFDYTTIEGKVYNSDEHIAIRKVPAKYIVLDFWYTTCYSCIKSLPSVINIAKKYDRKDVAVFGINMIDNEIKNKVQLDNFFTKHPMPYPTLMLNRARYEEMSPSYPTFIILNDKMEVVFYESGFDEDLETKVTEFFDRHLQR